MRAIPPDEATNHPIKVYPALVGGVIGSTKLDPDV